MTHSRGAVVLSVVLASFIGTTLGATPAFAHGDNPRVNVRLDGLSEDLPDDVLVQVRTSISEQMVASNPTDEVLGVVAPDGREFLEISADGVRAELNHPFFYRTLGPPDSPVPPADGARPGAEPRWEQVSAEPSWGWFDPRLHPADATDPASVRDTGEQALLAEWSIPLSYGGTGLEATGDLVLEPFLGSWQPGRIDAPPGVQVQVLPGPRPALALTRTSASSVQVLGESGRPILLLDDRGTHVAPGSEAALSTSGVAATPSPTSTQRLVPVGSGSFYAWLDPRVQPSSRAPVDPAAAVGDGWTIPAVVDGEQVTLRGEWRWAPADAAATAGTEGGSLSWWLVAALAVALALAAGIAFTLRRVGTLYSVGGQG